MMMMIAQNLMDIKCDDLYVTTISTTVTTADSGLDDNDIVIALIYNCDIVFVNLVVTNFAH